MAKKLLRKYWKETILAPFFKLAEAQMDLFVPLVVAAIINRSLILKEPRLLFIYTFLLVLLALIGMGFSFVAQWFAAKASIGFASDLRAYLYKHIQTLQFQDLDKLGVNTLITRLTSDINQVQTGLNLTLRLLLRSPFIVFGSMFFAFRIDYRSALVFTTIIVLLIVAVFVIMLVSVPLYSRVQRQLDKLMEATRENLLGVRVIRSFRKEKQEIDHFDSVSKSLTKMNLFVAKIASLLNPLSFLLINIATIFLLRINAVEVSLGSLKQGDVVALYNYMAQICVELIKMASLMITMNKSFASYKRIQTVCQITPSFSYPSSSPQKDANAPALEFDHVTFAYDDASLPSVKDISFTLEKGKTLGIIGGTGSGKSTLVQLIPRFYDIKEGKISLFGNDVKSYAQKDLQGMIALVFQKAMLFEGTIRDNLLLANAQSSDDDIHMALSISQAEEFVLAKGLDHPLEQSGRNLSGGQKQRLTIARALLKKADILILDDSSSALDFRTDFRLRQAIQSLQTTVIIVAQRVASVRNCDEILVLDDGMIAERGTHESLLAKHGIYEEIYLSQTAKEANDENIQ